MMYPYRRILSIILDRWTSGSCQSRAALREGFCAHYAHVRQAVPAERLLEFEPKDGWEPLCDFLGVEVPSECNEQSSATAVKPFPRVNDGESVVKLHGMLYWWRLGTVLAKGVGVLGAIGGVATAVWWARKARARSDDSRLSIVLFFMQFTGCIEIILLF